MVAGEGRRLQHMQIDLCPEQIEQVNNDGFIALDAFADPECLALLRHKVVSPCVDVHGVLVFCHTANQPTQTRNPP
jgi:hypothetical protein